MEDDVLGAFARLVLKGYTLRRIREELKTVEGVVLPEDDAPLVRLMRDILNHKEET